MLLLLGGCANSLLGRAELKREVPAACDKLLAKARQPPITKNDDVRAREAQARLQIKGVNARIDEHLACDQRVRDRLAGKIK